MRTLIISMGLVCMVLLNSCSSSQQITSLGKELKWLEGEWLGQGFQLDGVGSQTWEIDLEVDLDKKICNIEYPSLECNGKWQLIKGNNHAATFKEVIIKGKNRCYDGGELVITKVNENHLSYSFFYPENGQLGAYSTLIKKEFHKKLNTKHL